MRFETLQLTRYGPFTDCTLSLPPAPLVLIYGPNEAGKSSALAALTDLLYGIGHQTPYAFRHAYGDLRLGGVISNRRGQRLALVRRKGRRNTLLDADDRPLPDDALAPFLAGVDRALFTRAFGLSQVGLRSGAEQLLQSNGALGEGLLEAGTGLKSLKALGEDLDARADELFGKRHSARRAVEQGLVRYRQAVEALRSDSLDPKVWGEALERVAEAEASEHDLRGRLEALGTRHRHLLWIQRLQPLKRRREQLRAQLASLGEVPDLPRDMASRCDHWLERRRQAQVDLGAVQRQMEELRTALAQCQVDPVVLAARDTIVALDEVRRDRRTAVEEGRPTLGRARAEVDRALGAIARRLGRSASRAAADYPGDGALARVRRLAGEGLGLERAALAAEEQQSTAAVHLEALAAEREALTAIADPSPLRRQYQSLEDLAALDDQRLRLRHHHQSAQRRLEEAWGALEPRPGDLDALAVKPVPSRDEVEAFADREAGLERENQALGADRERADRARRDALARLRQLEGEDELPTAAVIDRVRAERDRHWRQLRARWGAASVWAGVASHGDEDPGDGLEEASHGGVGEGQTLAAFEAALAQVDILQERRASQAQRLADYAQAQEALRGEQIRLAELDAAATHHRRAMEQFATQWRGLWHNTGIIPRSPRAMGHWLTRREGVLARRLELEDAAAEGALAEARWQRAEARRRQLTQALGLAATAPLEAIAAALEALEARWQRAATWASEHRAATLAHERAAQTAQACRHELAAWQRAFAAAATPLGLQATDRGEAVEAVVKAWEALPPLWDKRRDLDDQLQRLDVQVAAFTRQVGEIAAVCAPDVDDQPPWEVAAALKERLDANRLAAAERASLDRRLAEAKEHMATLTRDRDEAAAALADLMAEARVTSLDALPGRLRAADTKGRLAAEAAALEAEWREALGARDSEPPPSPPAELDLDPAQLARQLEALEAELTGLHRALQEQIEATTRHKAARDALARQDGAGKAALNRQQALTDLERDGREWLLTRAAALLLRSAVVHYRRQHQSPLLAMASQCFARLTHGSCRGIDIDVGDGDGMRLVAVRPDGSQVGMAGLSEGTLDQLYLALRIAHIERFAAQAEPLPLVGDDLLVSFDDPRATLALEELAALGAHTQVLLFTHHRHLVGLAEEALGDEVAVVPLGAMASQP